ncbi:MAG: FAD-binding oxidoreductase [Planctomycetota bacterium]|jgi:alkyldihydroxyacetonephosphate synthase
MTKQSPIAASRLSPRVLEKLGEIFPGRSLSTNVAERIASGSDCWPRLFIERRLQRIGPAPDAVAWPETLDQVVAVTQLAQREGFALTPYGGGSGVCGGAIPLQGGVTLDLKRLNRLIDVRESALLCEAEAGINGQHFEEALNRRGYTLGHFPSSIVCSTLGGWLAARSSGQASTRYGNVEDLCAGLEAVLPDGRVALIPPMPRSAAGPDWRHVLIGSEGTLGTITRAWMRIRPLPEAREFLCFRFPTVAAGVTAIRRVLQRGYRPAVTRLYDPLDTLVGVAGGGGDKQGLFDRLLKGAFEKGKKLLLRHPRLAPLAEVLAGGCHAVFMCEGETALTQLEARVIREEATRAGAEDRGPDGARHWYDHRYDISFKGAPVFQDGGFVDTMEVAAPWDRIEVMYDAVKAAIARHAVCLAHFSHAYRDGVSIYFTFAVAPPDEASMLETYDAIWRDGPAAALAAGGTSTHHLKADAMAREIGPLHDALRALKAGLDPKGIMNPGKLGL